MYKPLYVTLTLLSTLSSHSASAEIAETQASVRLNIAIIYVPGIRNTESDALSASLTLRKLLLDSAALKLKGYKDKDITFYVASNETEGLVGDVLEAFLQATRIDRIIWFLKHNWNYCVEAAHRVSGDLGNGITDDTLTWLHWDLSQEEIDLARQFNLYATLLKSGAQKIVIVAHSQGNYFTNIVYGMLIDKFGRDLIKQRVGVVSVANPDFYVAGGGPETTLKQDTVISSIYRYKVQHILSEPWTTILSPGNVNLDSGATRDFSSGRKYQVGDIYFDERTIMVVVLFLWVLLWKGWALWIAANKRHKVWFLVLLFFNTLGLLDMLYIFIVSKTGGVKRLPGVTSAEHVIQETEKRENS